MPLQSVSAYIKNLKKIVLSHSLLIAMIPCVLLAVTICGLGTQ